jgi:hypothetical protein
LASEDVDDSGKTDRKDLKAGKKRLKMNIS